MDPNQNTSSSAAPSSAGDVDVIEREWVEQAKKIIKEYENDPYNQQVHLSKLQVEYLYKRYGKKIAIPS